MVHLMKYRHLLVVLTVMKLSIQVLTLANEIIHYLVAFLKYLYTFSFSYDHKGLNKTYGSIH